MQQNKMLCPFIGYRGWDHAPIPRKNSRKSLHRDTPESHTTPHGPTKQSLHLKKLSETCARGPIHRRKKILIRIVEMDTCYMHLFTFENKNTC
jgi:hypothetical protein